MKTPIDRNTNQQKHQSTEKSFLLILIVFLTLLLLSCNESLTQFSGKTMKENLSKEDSKTLHIVKATLNSVSGRYSYWTVEINYGDSLHQHGTTYLKATISDPPFQTTVTHRMGRSIQYTGPYNNTRVKYNVQFVTPCYFNQNGYYHYKIFYYEDDGTTRIDNYPSSTTINVYHPLAQYPCK